MQSEIIFIDYGNGEVKPNKEIVELPGGLSAVEPFAQKYCLLGLKDAHEVDSIGYEHVCIAI